MSKAAKKYNKKVKNKKITRRQFLKLGGIGFASMTVAGAYTEKLFAKKSLQAKELAMVIDLQRCTGCGACEVACKNENNVQEGFAWAHHIIRTTGKFPNVKYEHLPTLCNHCKKPACARICPTKAMHKSDGGITMHSPNKCIGCKSCIAACPYSVISYNSRETHKFWCDNEQLIKNCTDSPEGVTRRVGGTVIPVYNPDREKNIKKSGLRHKGIVEKCTFCDHLVKRGKLPYCVQKCPSNARIFGDLNDSRSKVRQILGKYRPMRLRQHLGTKPKVYYVRDFNPRHYTRSKGSI